MREFRIAPYYFCPQNKIIWKWNEHMDCEKTDGSQIIYGVHIMIDHLCWTLQNLINMKS